MVVHIHEFEKDDILQMIAIWNEVIDAGVAFPYEDELDQMSAETYFGEQTYTAVAVEGDEILGLYTLHPNGVGRASHIANASYAVRSDQRGRGIGRQLVSDCLVQAKHFGFRILQFNAVVASNASALHLYRSLGFIEIGRIPGAFRMKDDSYEDTILFYYDLTEF